LWKSPGIHARSDLGGRFQSMIRAKKSLGQNFLIDGRVVNRIIQTVSPLTSDVIIEIGPGTGALTVPLARQAGFLVAIEADARLVNRLQSLIESSNARIVGADALSVDWDSLIDSALAEYGELSRGESLKYPYVTTEAIGPPMEIATGQRTSDVSPRMRVVANLPYYISTAILQILLEHKSRFHDFTLMLQDEVVDRIASGPGSGEYGYLSVLAQYYCEVEKLFEVPAASFKPAPKVQSAVVQLTVRDTPPILVEDEARFFSLIKVCFAQRRKTLLNNLKAASPALRLPTGLSDADSLPHPPLEATDIGTISSTGGIESALLQAGIDPRRRAETFSLDEFASIYAAVCSGRS
jgi:16S rRNA (adenine1518-N6/adenine1519-N6)-dimethyltransferase